MIVVATDEEYKIALNKFDDHMIIRTGVGGLNVIKHLKDLPRTIPITNFGFVGSNTIPIGTEVRIGRCELYHPNIGYREEKFQLDGDITCYTTSDFIPVKAEGKFVADMELAYILALGFKNVESIKIVSDPMDSKEYYKFIEKYKKENEI